MRKNASVCVWSKVISSSWSCQKRLFTWTLKRGLIYNGKVWSKGSLNNDYSWNNWEVKKERDGRAWKEKTKLNLRIVSRRTWLNGIKREEGRNLRRWW